MMLLQYVWLSLDQASNNTVVMNFDDDDDKLCCFGLSFVDVCLFVCARQSTRERMGNDKRE
jgi:hypothetical protein